MKRGERERQRKSLKSIKKRTRKLEPLEEGQTRRLKPFSALGDSVWKKGQVIKRLDEKSYDVQTKKGNIIGRNREQNKPTSEIPIDMIHTEFNAMKEKIQITPTEKKLKRKKKTEPGKVKATNRSHLQKNQPKKT